MVLMQNSDAPFVADINMTSHAREKGNGVFLSPWTGGSYANPYYRHNKNGEGIADLFKSGLEFFKTIVVL